MKICLNILLALLFLSFCQEEGTIFEPGPEIELKDFTADSGLEVYMVTFGVAIADVNNDGADDLVISNHGNKLPALFLNENGYFEDESDLLPDLVIRDRHGVTVVDLENDGDKDLVFAGGGGDGVGEGSENRIYENRFTDAGILQFKDISDDVGIAFQPWRSRHFLPLPGPDGSKVDLYLTCKERENCPNLYFSNRSGVDIKLVVDESMGLNLNCGCEGKEIFFDFDRDGDQDLLIISKSIPTIFERIANHYYKKDSLIPGMTNVYCLGVGDLNNDGFPDLYLGKEAVNTGSDNISFSSKEIHFVVKKQEADFSDQVKFNITGKSIDINFIQHLPSGEDFTDPSNIFIGEQKINPLKRVATITAEMARGEPIKNKPGIYIWKNPDVDLWHLEWIYAEEREDRGLICASSVSNLVSENFEVFSPVEINDRIFINKNGVEFEELIIPGLIHSGVTRTVVVCDLNNDGFLDILGIRGSEAGQYNGDPFLLVNSGDLNFGFKPIMQNSEDDIFQADQMVYGFFNNDGLADIFFTNGFGLSPGNYGPYKLFLNQTQNAGNYIILELEGSTSNRDAIGAEVELYTKGGEFLGYRQLGSGYNRSQNTHSLHFGLGWVEDEIKSRIRWPGTSEWDEREVSLNQVNFIKQEL